jgi:hypothetical protein
MPPAVHPPPSAAPTETKMDEIKKQLEAAVSAEHAAMHALAEATQKRRAAEEAVAAAEQEAKAA